MGHSTSDPLSPDELLERDNEHSAKAMPADMRESMSDRLVHLSIGEDRDAANLAELADDLARTSSFRLPAGAFLGQLGRDGAIQEDVQDSGESEVAPYRPEWQDLVYHPKVAPMPVLPERKGRDGTTVRLHRAYPPENRTPFRPEGYPWTCIGRIQVFEFGQPKRIGTAALVGNRTIVTSAHLMPRDGSGGNWGVLFVPGYFNGQSTVGMSSWCEQYRAVVGPAAVNDSTQDRDIAVLKLYQPLGAALGTLGIKTYNDDWEDQGVWTLVGYPGSITNGERPTFQSGIPVIDDDPSGDWNEIEHRGDATDGNSGGPLFATFPDGPYIVGVHSGDEYRVIAGVVAENNNVCAGGVALPRLVNSVNTQWP
jgi:V8-like Glu-specific endopeptidase